MDLADPHATRLLTDLLAAGASAQFVVTGASMRPFLVGSETVVLSPVRPTEIRRGDLLLCRYTGERGARLLLHRAIIIRRRDGLPALIQTQGDALGAPDEPVSDTQVLGRVVAVLDAAGAAPVRLDTCGQRARSLLIALRQFALWRGRLAWAAFGHYLCRKPSRKTSF